MEKNKLDSIRRMTKEMREVVDFEVKQSQQMAQQDCGGVSAKEAYIKTRMFWNQGAPPVFNTRDEMIDGPLGTIPFRLYYSEDSEDNHCIIYIHGGGFVLGNIDTHDGIMRRLANATGAVVAGIDYRLGPEFTVADQILECIALVEFIHRNGKGYQMNGNHISLAGDSAGAYLSLASCLSLRDRGEDLSYIKSLLLYYGAYGLRDSMSRRLYGGYWDGLRSEDLESYNKLATAPEQENPYRYIFDVDLTFGIPPAYIMACDLDPLLDDSKLLYAILSEHGTKTELKIYEGVIHAFLHYAKMLPQSGEAIEHSAAFYKRYAMET